MNRELTDQASRGASMPTSSTSHRELTDAEKMALPCFQAPKLWQDSNKIEDQRQAARLCATSCAQRAWCERERLATASEFGLAVGVWSATIWTHRDYMKDGDSHSLVIARPA